MFESIKDSLNQKSTSDNSMFKDIIKMEKGNTYIVRLVPNVEDIENTIFHYFAHIWKSNADQKMVNVFCPNSYGDRCPIDEYRSKVWKTGDEEKQKEISALRRNEYHMVNVYVIKDPTNPENQGQVKILRYGKQLASVVDSAITGDDSDEFGSKVFDLSPEGCNLKIKVTENEGGFANYTMSRFQSASEIEGLDDIDTVYEKIHSLNTMYTHQSYDEIQKVLDRDWFCKVTSTNSSVEVEDDDDEDDDEEDDVEPPAPKKTKKGKVAKEDDEDGDSVTDPELDELLKNL